MLQRAAAARAEMGAGGRDPVRGGLEDFCLCGKSIAAPGQRAGLNQLAGKRVGEKEFLPAGSRRDAVAVRADALDADGI